MIEQSQLLPHPLNAIASQFETSEPEAPTTTSDALEGEPPPTEGKGSHCTDDNAPNPFQQKFEQVRQHPQPVQMAFDVMVARLNNADTLRAEMLDEEFGRLASRLVKTAISTLAPYGALVYPYGVFGFVIFFLPDDGSGHHPMQTIQAALDLKARMIELGREWKIRKGWLHNLELNIGINSGNELIMALPTARGDNLMPLGDAQTVAAGLSELAVNGQIWTTKTLINQVPPGELKHLRFGIFRGESDRQVFVSRCFSRIRDLSGGGRVRCDVESDLGAQAVTQIFDRQGHG